MSFLLGDEDIVQLLERKNDIKFERADIEEFNQPIMIKKYDKESKLYFIRKDDKLKKYSSDLWIPAGANWETLFGFYFEKEIPIKVHIYYIGRKFDWINYLKWYIAYLLTVKIILRYAI